MADEVAVVETKAWYASKTVWINLITTVVGVLGFIAGSDWIAQNPAMVAGLTSAVGVLNVILRLVTGKAVA
jgi:hypothetical protein